SGNIAQTGATTFSTGTGTNTLNGATTIASTLTVNGSALFKNTANSTTAFQIQNSASVNIFNVDTSSKIITMDLASSGGAKGLQVNMTDTATTGFGVGSALVLNTNPASNSSASVLANGFVAQPTSGATIAYSGDYIASYSQVNWQGAGNTSTGRLIGSNSKVITNSGAGSVTNAIAFLAQNTLNSTVTNSYAIKVSDNAGATAPTNAYGVYVDNMTSGTNKYPLYVASATANQPLLSVNSTGQTVYRNSTNSTTALQVQNSSAGAVFNVDTTNSRIGIGNTAPTAMLSIGPNPVAQYSPPELLQLGRTGDAYLTVSDGTGRLTAGTTSGVPFIGSQTNTRFDLRVNNLPVFQLDTSGRALAQTTLAAQTSNASRSLQGAYIEWNVTNGSGETDFINNRGTGAGGFRFYNGVNGAFNYIADISSTGVYTALSDGRLKTNVQTISSALDKITQLNGVTYDFINGMGNNQTGLIAQDVYNVLPQAVTIDPQTGNMMLAYGNLAGLFVEGIKEQQTQIVDAQNRLSALENSIQPAQNNVLDLTNGGTIQGTLNVAGNLNVTGPVTLSSLTVTGDVNIGGNLTVKDISVANLTINGHIITAGDTPTIVAGAAAGAEDTIAQIPAPVATVDGNDTSGTITIVAGANTLPGDLVEVTFNSPFSKTPRVVLNAGNEQTANLKFYRDADIGKFRIKLAQAPTAGQTYTFDYFIVQ
ncbi:MAG: hypothetical protein QG647_415, partial [Patescibacteria group bacterium]|nr:hypothetical protein [Patescibacteria group bacterium]